MPHVRRSREVYVTSDPIPEALGWLLESARVPVDVQSVALKLNLCEYRAGDSGATTPVAFVAALAAALRLRCTGLRNILLLEADSSGTRAKDLFALLGFVDLAAQEGLDLFVPEEAAWSLVDTLGELPVEIPQVVYEVDLLVNVPKLKFHGKTAFSGALKNNFGLLRRKWKLPYHGRLCEAIIASNLHLPPQLVVMDGLTALAGRGPSYGIPFAPSLMLASWDPVAVDTTGARLLGLPPFLVGHLRLARHAGLGSDRPTVQWRDGEQGLSERPSFDWLRFVTANVLRRS